MRVVSEPIAVLLGSGYTLSQIKTAFEDVTWATRNDLTPDLKALKAEVLSLIEEGEGEGEA